MPKMTELRPNKGLRKPNFEQYESLPENVKIRATEDLENYIFHRDVSPDGQSTLQGRGVFDFHNHLHAHPSDHHAHGLSWFADEVGTIWRLGDYWPLESKFHYSYSETNLYNCSVAFASLEITAFSYGTDMLFIMYDYDKCDKCTESNECGDFDECQYNDSTAKIEPGILMDAKYLEDQQLFKVVICSIADHDGNKATKIVILSFHLDIQVNVPDDLELSRKQEFLVNGDVDHVYIESSGNFLNILSHDRPRIIFDSLKPEYCWSQDDESLTVWLKVPETYQNYQPSVDISQSQVIVIFRYTCILEGEWQFCLDPDSVAWTREKDIVEFKLMKEKVGQTWSQLITGSSTGEYLPDKTLAAEVCSRFSNLSISNPSNNEQPTDEFAAKSSDEYNLEEGKKHLRRIDLNSYVITDAVALDVNDRLLFTHYYRSEKRLFIKQGNDVCVWNATENHKGWNITHVLTYPALGDIVESNENRRLLVSPPDCHYIALIERSRYAFIYDKPARKKKVGKMRTVDLGEEATTIMGAAATNLYLIILTENKAYKILA